jgi:hypothetical protein
MKYSYLSLVVLAVLLTCFLSACSSGPSTMNQLAQKAKNEATEVQAETFAQELWISAEKAWQDGNARLEAKKPGEADKFFLKAKTDYVKARDSAKSKRDFEIRQINDALTWMSIHLKSDLLENPAAKNLSPARKKDFDAIVKEIEDTSGKITEQVKAGQIMEAKLLAQKTQRAIYDVQQEYLKK